MPLKKKKNRLNNDYIGTEKILLKKYAIYLIMEKLYFTIG